LYDRLKQGEEEERRPTYEDIYTVLVETSKSFAQTFVICDALDECDRHELREILLPLFHHMGKSGLRLFLTSRRYADDIEDFYCQVPWIEISAHKEDVRSYISQRINASLRAKRMIRGSASGLQLEEDIISALVDAANGM
jgi:isopenicillin N synthase-like dioxygenase